MNDDQRTRLGRAALALLPAGLAVESGVVSETIGPSLDRGDVQFAHWMGFLSGGFAMLAVGIVIHALLWERKP